jgi:hypothetical protein
MPNPCALTFLVTPTSARYAPAMKPRQKKRLLIEHHRSYLERHGGVRPKRFDSFHCAITEEELRPFKDAWIPEFRDRHGLAVQFLRASSNGRGASPSSSPTDEPAQLRAD